MKHRIVATARVKLEIELRASSHWGNDCTIEQVQKQAAEDVLDQLNRLAVAAHPYVRIVAGTPRVTAVIVDEDAEK